MAPWIPSVRLDFSAHRLYSVFHIYLLIGVGLYFTVRTTFVQVRLLPSMFESIGGSRSNAEGGISAFQAFCVGLASRVGTGNIAGVAIAITLVGPGAIFWMWLVAVVGMATAFVEATPAQMYKVRNPYGSFRGGPALGKWAFGALADFEAMRREGRDDKFVGRGNSHLPGDLPGDVWDPVLDNDPTMNKPDVAR